MPEFYRNKITTGKKYKIYKFTTYISGILIINVASQAEGREFDPRFPDNVFTRKVLALSKNFSRIVATNKAIQRVFAEIKNAKGSFRLKLFVPSPTKRRTIRKAEHSNVIPQKTITFYNGNRADSCRRRAGACPHLDSNAIHRTRRRNRDAPTRGCEKARSGFATPPRIYRGRYFPD